VPDDPLAKWIAAQQAKLKKLVAGVDAIRADMEAAATGYGVQLEMLRLRFKELQRRLSVLEGEPFEPPPVVPPSEEPVDPIMGRYEGFGNATTGGEGHPEVHVDTLADDGVGSLRAALAAGNRRIVFDIGGTITLKKELAPRGANITIDGFSAPSPGISLKGRMLTFRGSNGCRNIIVRGIRHRGTDPVEDEDCFQCFGGVTDFVFDHCSLFGFQDGGLDITEDCSNGTVSWCILGPGRVANHNLPMLIGPGSQRISIHHNGFFKTAYRNPAVSPLSPTTEIGADVRNNLMWKHEGHGVQVHNSGRANVVNNYLFGAPSSDSEQLYHDNTGRMYTAGNYSHNGYSINDNGNQSTPYAAIIPPSITSAIEAAHKIISSTGAGAWGANFDRDSVDNGLIADVVGLAPIPGVGGLAGAVFQLDFADAGGP
jgi:pectate lyase